MCPGEHPEVGEDIQVCVAEVFSDLDRHHFDASRKVRQPRFVEPVEEEFEGVAVGGWKEGR